MTNVLKIKDLAQCNTEPDLIDNLFIVILSLYFLNILIALEHSFLPNSI